MHRFNVTLNKKTLEFAIVQIKTVLFLIILLILFSHTQIPLNQGDIVIPNFKLKSGKSISPLHLHYQTLGTPERDSKGHITNAVLLLHYTTGTGSVFLTPNFIESLFEVGKPLDMRRFFIVMPDCIGAGGSSKPSDGAYGKFPEFGYLDQIEAIHKMLQTIGIFRERLVLGISMGGMLTWLWGEYFPNEVDALVAVASTPSQISGRNLFWRKMITDAILNDPDWNDGQPIPNQPLKEWSKTVGPLSMIMADNPIRIQQNAFNREATNQLFDEVIKKTEASLNPYDILFMYKSSFDYNPRPDLGKITSPFLAINFIDDLINPPELLNIPTQSNFHMLMIEKESDLYGHKGIFHPEVWGKGVANFMSMITSAFN